MNRPDSLLGASSVVESHLGSTPIHLESLLRSALSGNMDRWHMERPLSILLEIQAAPRHRVSHGLGRKFNSEICSEDATELPEFLCVDLGREWLGCPAIWVGGGGGEGDSLHAWRRAYIF